MYYGYVERNGIKRFQVQDHRPWVIEEYYLTTLLAEDTSPYTKQFIKKEFLYNGQYYIIKFDNQSKYYYGYIQKQYNNNLYYQNKDTDISIIYKNYRNIKKNIQAVCL